MASSVPFGTEDVFFHDARLAIAQINAAAGHFEGNTRAIGRWIREAKKVKDHVALFPELAVLGYSPKDLLLIPKFFSCC